MTLQMLPFFPGSPLARLIAMQRMAGQQPPAAAGSRRQPPIATPGARSLQRRDPVSQLAAGPADPRLPPEQNERIRRGALGQAGAAGLIATSRMPRGGLLGVIGTALATGQQYAQGEVEHFIENMPEADLETLVITRPDGSMDLINKMTGEVIANLGEPEHTLAEPKVVQTLGGQKVLASWDPKQRAYVGLDGNLLPGAVPIEEDVRGVKDTFIGADGRKYTAFFDPTSGEQIGPARLAEAETGLDADDAGLLAELRLRLQNIKRIFAARSGQPFGILEEALADRTLPLPGIMNEALRSTFTTPQIQQFSADADAFVQIMVKAREGGRPSDKDREFILNFTKPRSSDDPEVIAQKLRRMEQYIELMETDPGSAFDRALGMAQAHSGGGGTNTTPNYFPRRN